MGQVGGRRGVKRMLCKARNKAFAPYELHQKASNTQRYSFHTQRYTSTHNDTTTSEKSMHKDRGASAIDRAMILRYNTASIPTEENDHKSRHRQPGVGGRVTYCRSTCDLTKLLQLLVLLVAAPNCSVLTPSKKAAAAAKKSSLWQASPSQLSE